MKLPRLHERLKANEISEDACIEMMTLNRAPLIDYKDQLVMKPVVNLSMPDNLCSLLDLVWNCGWFSSSGDSPRPNWHGFIETATSLIFQIREKTQIEFMPLIDLNSADENCIFSVLTFITEQATKLGITTPCVTYDLPLWLKAIQIQKSQNIPIVCRLGGFHTLMSFIGSLGNLMKGSGLEQLFEQVYATNSVPHLFSGKQYARGAHIMVHSALSKLLLEIVCDKFDGNIDFMSEVYSKATQQKLDQETLDQSISDERLVTLNNKISETKRVLRESGRTPQLWLLYMEYVELIKLYVFAERSSNWNLHLYCLTKMLKLFAATGHANYAKCARFYVQEMQDLPTTNSWLHEMFLQGTVKRSSKNLNGLSTDLSIEQTLMRAIHSRGGHGRGFDEGVCPHDVGVEFEFLGQRSRCHDGANWHFVSFKLATC